MTVPETILEQEVAQGWQRVNPLAILVSAVQGMRQAVLPAVAALFGARSLDNTVLVVGVIAAAVLVLVTLGAWLSWRRLRYLVGPEDIRVEQGLISRSARSVPYERIQDVSLEQGLLPRLLGLVEVRFETGAGGKDELKLAYVSMDEGERLRDVVREQRTLAPVAAAASESEAQPEAEGRLLFAMGPGRLLLFGLFEFSLIVFAVLAGATQQLEFLLPFDLWDVDQWEGRLSGTGWEAWLTGLGMAAQLVGVLIALASLVVLGLVTGVARTVLRDWQFRLDLTSRGFRRRRGLLTKTDVVMPAARVQAIIVSTGFVRRLWGWRGLSFVSLAQDAGSANHDVAPFAQESEIAPIVEVAGFTLPDDSVDWHRPSRAYRFDRALFTALPLVMVGIVLLFIEQVAWAAPLVWVLAVLLALRQHFLWRFERHAVDRRQILSRRGWLSPRLVAASRIKLHSVEIAQGPLGRWRGYADLRFGLAGGALAFEGLLLEEAEAMREAVLTSIASVDFSALPR
ncbi:PH domain-containing protein [Altererythrobacter sp. KTW20L]|uniref:PH domain-containing protein n=1 Tax=Altererythrobacter sp. KTW20L TaxID=2942210 RepID=UPI0020BE535C|nr:PH domain-containing protein [Altererythrobacter sp. KTW20L]